MRLFLQIDAPMLDVEQSASWCHERQIFHAYLRHSIQLERGFMKGEEGHSGNTHDFGVYLVTDHQEKEIYGHH